MGSKQALATLDDFRRQRNFSVVNLSIFRVFRSAPTNAHDGAGAMVRSAAFKCDQDLKRSLHVRKK
jgi:hypothetical protein